MRAVEFVVQEWNAWAPGTDSHKAWQEWLGHQIFDQSVKSVSPTLVSKQLLRRLSPLGRAVFKATENFSDSDRSKPIVFSSAHGEVNKSLEMLKNMHKADEVSPTAFSLSVHNAIAGLFSIANNNHQEITVLASGQDGIAPAFLEALGLLQEHHKEVLMILYDEPLSDFYPSLPFALNAPAICALVLKVSLTGNGTPLRFCRSVATREDGEHALQIFAFLKFLVSDDKALELGNHRHSWEWRKI